MGEVHRSGLETRLTGTTVKFRQKNYLCPSLPCFCPGLPACFACTPETWQKKLKTIVKVFYLIYLLTVLNICDNTVYFKTFDAKINFFELLVSEKLLFKVSLPCDRSLRQAGPNWSGEIFLSGRVAGGPRQLPILSTIHIYDHTFLIADVPRPILGSDFFSSLDLLIDVKNRQLVRLPRLSAPLAVLPAVPDSSTKSVSVSGLHTPRTNAVEALLDHFPRVLVSTFDSTSPLAHGVQHVVPTVGPPVFARPRRLAGDKLVVARAEFEKMLRMGIVRRSSSPWASPLHIVPKANGGWHPCDDYQQLNSCLLYTSPSPRDLSTSRMPSSA